MKIEVLGTSCTLCRTLFGNALEALRESGKKGRVVLVEDIRKIMKYRHLAAPVLIINGVVIFSGRLVSPEEISAMMKSLSSML